MSGHAPTWSKFALAIPVAMTRLHRLEKVSNLGKRPAIRCARCTRHSRGSPRCVFAIYVTLRGFRALGEPVVKEAAKTSLGKIGEGAPWRLKNDPFRVVENLGLTAA